MDVIEKKGENPIDVIHFSLNTAKRTLFTMLKRILLVGVVLCLGQSVMAQTAAPVSAPAPAKVDPNRPPKDDPNKEAKMAADVENIEFVRIKAAMVKYDPSAEDVLKKAYIANLKAVKPSKDQKVMISEVTTRMRTFNATTKELVILAEKVVSKNKTGITKPTTAGEIAYTKLMADIAAGKYNLGDAKQSKVVVEQVSKLKKSIG